MAHLAEPGVGARSTSYRDLYWIQGLTLSWMVVEFGVSAYAAAKAHSPALAAFGSDSLVELFSAVVVLLQWVPGLRLGERTAARAAAVLLFVLAAVVGVIAAATLALHLAPETSAAGMAITLAALAVMPALVYWKRRESRRRGNAALAADAVQSAACAYLALIAFAGLTARALFHIGWFDPAAAFVAIPLLIKEGRAAWKGALCNCCNAC